ncbi:MAG: pyruvate carboxylase [Myxococcota bacterium]
MSRAFQKILVANRGEIAIRIFRAATELELATVAVYSYEDRLALHRYKADEAWLIGTRGEPLKAYLDGEAILELAKRRQVDAIHPGYGFLSENADFARRCEEEGIVFIGPSHESIAALGDKVSARALAQAAQVPVIPGTKEPVASAEDAMHFARGVGFPVILKAAFGGGGRGMRKVSNEGELHGAFEAATREALSAFGRGEIFVEKFVERPRHIEVQVLGDRNGNVVHLFDRDCSVQRRHQKVVEIAPAVGLSDDTRQTIYADALRVAQQAKLSNAATVEFLVGEDEQHYFIEVNPRLQVEHTITELITGIDIVQAQIRLAEGKLLGEAGLPLQGDISRRGAAIQARLTTEDPGRGFAPDTGYVTAYRSAAGNGIRLDVGIAGAGAEVTPYYDSLLVKVSAWALSHEEAARKLSRSLKEFRVRGVATNLAFLDNIVSHPDLIAGRVDTGFVERTPQLFTFPRRQNRASRVLTALADTVVNGPPGIAGRLERPSTVVPIKLPARLDAPARAPFKSILDQRGPEALMEAVRQERRVLVTDTTFRDAHQSLLATRVRTHDMVRIAGATEDRLPGAFSVECWGGATFDVAYRFLREDPWQRLAMLREQMPDMLLQMLLRGSNAVGYTNYPANVLRRFIQEASRMGIDGFRIFDCFNSVDAMRLSIDEVRAAGKVAEVAICFTGDLHDVTRSQYNLDYYRRKATAAAEAGAHMIAIKDMAGLLRPGQAGELVRALKREVDLPLHMHTHDTAGAGVAMLLDAVEAGVDVIDGAIASMSGLTSQPSLDAVVASLQGHERAPLLDLNSLQELSDYWEAVRTLYAPFESGLRSSTADVYRHEIPGGQYSNLKPQALAVGLADQWNDVRERYREVNFALGDIIKVTPSSKVVGDFALWLVRQGLSMTDLLASDVAYDFPRSVIELFEGAIGVPDQGFPETLRQRVLGENAAPLPDRPFTETLAPYDFESKRAELERIVPGQVNATLELSYALYPQVIKDYLAFRKTHGDVIGIDTDTFLYGLDEGREVLIDIEPGKSLVVMRTAVSELREDNTRQVHFVLNGQPRAVLIDDRTGGEKQVKRRTADPVVPGDVGAPMPGSVLAMLVRVGDEVEEGAPLCTMEAMKLETTVRAPMHGRVQEVLVNTGDRVVSGELMLVLQSVG